MTVEGEYHHILDIQIVEVPLDRMLDAMDITAGLVGLMEEDGRREVTDIEVMDIAGIMEEVMDVLGVIEEVMDATGAMKEVTDAEIAGAVGTMKTTGMCYQKYQSITVARYVSIFI